MAFKHLCIEEREKYFAWRQAGVSLRNVAGKLGRNHSTLSREFSRNTRWGKPYLPCHAQRRADRVSERQRYKAPLKGPETFLYVREHLRSPFFWSPETISGRIGIDIPGASIDPETIYRYIYGKGAGKYKLWQYLSSGRRKRMRKSGRGVRNKGKVPNAVSIDVRPKSVSKRKEVGHWETDNMEGPRFARPALSVSVERVFRLTLITKMPKSTSEEKTKALVKRLNNVPKDLRLSLTCDNGKENYGHESTKVALGMEMYFCHAYHSWEKGTVENRNRKARRFFPKGTDFTYVTGREVRAVERIINNTPMKCLGYLTPYEKMSQYLNTVKTT